MEAVSISPTPMDRWRISVMGKPVLSLPINIFSEYPSVKLKEHIGAGQERETIFLFCAGIKFLQYIAGAEASGFSLKLHRWSKVL